MTLTAISLLLLSAIIHAGWNLLGKRQAPDLVFFFQANLSIVVFLLPLLAYYGTRAFCLPWSVWALVAATGVFEALYYSALASAYQRGEMSIAYPLARALPILLITIVMFIIGKGSQINFQPMLGFIMILAGCILLPIRNRAALQLKQYTSPVMQMALLAAIGTAGYSIVDDQALRLLRNLPQIHYSALDAALVYSIWQGVSAVVFLIPLLILNRNRSKPGNKPPLSYPDGAVQRAQTPRDWRLMITQAALMGIGIYASYLCVLVAMAYAPNVSYVVAFRQISIPLGTLLGVTVLKEKAYPLKFIGSLAIFAGLVLVGLG